MPRRKVALETGHIYHILSRSVQNLPIFGKPRQCQIFLESLSFYNQTNPPSKFSFRNNLNIKTDEKEPKKVVGILNYCLMPNHFHLTLEQYTDNGITFFMRHVLNSFSHFYNKKFNNRGPLFQGNFQAIKIEDVEQSVHLSRYIHLNPVTSCIVEKPEDYVFSSYRTYIGLERSILINTSPILSEFANKGVYKRFVLSQKDYQRRLFKIKKFILEQPQNFNS